MPTHDHQGGLQKCLNKQWLAKEKPNMETESKTVSRSELQSSQTGEILVRLFEITRELRGDHTTTLHTLTALEDTTTGD
jgi:hypothetical protein